MYVRKRKRKEKRIIWHGMDGMAWHCMAGGMGITNWRQGKKGNKGQTPQHKALHFRAPTIRNCFSKNKK